MDNARLRDFPPKTIDKVERLLDLLEELGEHPALRDKIALHGGTAINLFMLDIPRLSVDIDISYVGSLGREQMLSERPGVERAIVQVAQAQGYSLSGGVGGHAGRTFVLGYRSSWGLDHVKIDCIYMNRSPVLPIVSKSSPLREDLGVRVFSDAELIGGKVKAFFDRVKTRDLYDISNLRQWLSGVRGEQSETIRSVILYHASLSASFPHGFEGRPRRFEEMQSDLAEQLYPMLRQREGLPTIDSLILDAEAFIDSYVMPRSDDEREYLERFAAGDYQPGLLFSDADMARRASQSPEALWKLKNLRRMRP